MALRSNFAFIGSAQPPSAALYSVSAFLAPAAIYAHGAGGSRGLSGARHARVFRQLSMSETDSASNDVNTVAARLMERAAVARKEVTGFSYQGFFVNNTMEMQCFMYGMWLRENGVRLGDCTTYRPQLAAVRHPSPAWGLSFYHVVRNLASYFLFVRVRAGGV